MNYIYYKKEINNKVVQLAIFEKTPQQLSFYHGVSDIEEGFTINEMVEITIDEYKNLMPLFNLGQRYESPEPIER